MNLDRLLRPRSVAVYGGQWSDFVVEQCKRLGFDGALWRVHPVRDGCYRGADDLPGAPDSVFLGVNRDITIDEMAHLKRIGAGGAVVFASGFGELDDGAGHARRLAEAAGEVPYIGPNCYGFANFFDRVALWPDQAVGDPLERGIAFIGQSGTISLTLMYQRRSLPTGYVVTVGNQQRLTCADLVRHVADDERVSAIGLYIEGLGDVADFAAAVDHARRRGKPLALIKAGRSERSRAAALSHTGALTGSDVLHDALFARLGVARCETLDELVETLKLLHCHGPRPCARLVVAGASGGDMAMVSDAARDMPVEFAAFSDDTISEIAASTGRGVRPVNPLDFHTHNWFDAPRMRRMFCALLREDAALTAFMLDPPDETAADPAAYDTGIDAFLAAVAETGQPGAVVSSMPESLSRYNREKCLAASVAPMQGLASFLRAFSHAAAVGAAWANWRPPVIAGSGAGSTTPRMLGEYEGKALLSRFGVEVPRGTLCAIDAAADAARAIGGPVAVKAARADLAHKTEIGGVILNLTSPDEASAAARTLGGLTDTVLVEAMIDDTVAELIVGAGRDTQFGRFLTLGAGGIDAEMIADTVTLLPPFDDRDIAAALSRLTTWRRLAGWRNRPPGDIDAVVQAVLNTWRLVETLGDDLVELDVNPLIVRPAGRGAVAADVLITLKES